MGQWVVMLMLMLTYKLIRVEYGQVLVAASQITQSLLLVMENQTERCTGLLETHGVLLGVKMDTSESVMPQVQKQTDVVSEKVPTLPNEEVRKLCCYHIFT
jgi:hypothetical protein